MIPPAAVQRAATDAVRAALAAALASGYSPAEIAEAALAAAERVWPHEHLRRSPETTLAARIDLAPRAHPWKRSPYRPDLPAPHMDDRPFGFGITAMSQIPDSTGTGE